MRQREPKFSQLKELLLKIPPLKRAADGGLQATYQPSSHVHGNPEKRYPVLKDPTLVRAGQLACLDLFTTLPPQNKTEYVVKMYSLIEARFQNTRPLNICLQNLLPQSFSHKFTYSIRIQKLLPQSCSHQNLHTSLVFKSCYHSPAVSQSSKLRGSLSEAKKIKAKQKRGKCVCFSFFKCTMQKR